MYGVLYAMTPELFPTKDRGTGNGLAATANRIFGIMAPIIALYANLAVSYEGGEAVLKSYSCLKFSLDFSSYLRIWCSLHLRGSCRSHFAF